MNKEKILVKLQEISSMTNPCGFYADFDDWENSVVEANHKVNILIEELKGQLEINNAK